MNWRRVGSLVFVVLCIGALVGVARPPLQTAYGQFWTELHIAGMAFDFHFVLNVQDRGPEDLDQGNLSMQVFDWHTGELLALYRAVEVRNVRGFGGGVAFDAMMELVCGALPLPIEGFLWFVARPEVLEIHRGPLTLILPVQEGEVRIRTF